ncbi:isochorismatase family protein [Virgibacillus byunsanensis]|uniref:Isochorismatase family protein n=1 Tax=Virgibacillus byunsanensis TaxID=570945 RepID=A0ABW3LJ51_9BACI
MIDQLDDFGANVGFGEQPGVIVVDYINGFTDVNSPLGADLESELKATKRLLTLCRTREIPIIFTTVSYDPHQWDGGYFLKKVPALGVLSNDSPYVEVDPSLKWDPNKEPLLTKKFASAFFGTELQSLLSSMQVDTLLVLGCTTSGCVRATVVDGLQYGYRVIVPRECVGDRDRTAHEANLYDIHQKYGDVVSLDYVLEKIGVKGG